MRILIISTDPFVLTGLSKVIETLYTNESFNNDIIDFHFPSPCNDEMVNNLRKRGCNVFISNYRLKKPIKYIRSLKIIIKHGNYDLVHIHGNSHTIVLELLAAKLAKCPIRAVHAHSTKCNSLFLHKILTPFFNMLCTHRFACGIEAGKFLYGKKDFIVVKNGMKLEKFRFNEENRKLINDEYQLQNKTVIGCVANFVEVKNHTFMIDIINDLCKRSGNYILMLIGKGVLMDVIKEKVRVLALEDKVLFIGSTPDVHKYLSAMDIFLLPSHYEGVPLTLIEAQCNGIKCIASNNVPEEVNLTDSIRFLPINNGTSSWVGTIENTDISDDRSNLSADWIEKITDAGYNIDTQATQLLNLYKEFVE